MVQDARMPDAEMGIRLAHAESDAEIADCFPAMKELRPHLADESAFVAQVRRQMQIGYRILALWRNDVGVACAGYRILENLIYGRYIYVDDLVTAERERSQGHGERLMKALESEAIARGCRQFVLDSGVSNSAGHRFYFRQGLVVAAFHFRRPLQ